jgi:hypothetical protein
MNLSVGEVQILYPDYIEELGIYFTHQEIINHYGYKITTILWFSRRGLESEVTEDEELEY